MAEPSARTSRIVSLDQFRGYTVLAMFLVNFVGSFASIKATLPTLCHHHTHCSYADTIMPHFVFAVGIGYRLTFVRRREISGQWAAYRHAIERNLGLILLGFIVHHLDSPNRSWSQLQELGIIGWFRESFQRNFFQTLTHIGIASLWILPVIGARPSIRIVFAVVSGVTFHAISEAGYYAWVMKRPGIDGGPLGFLTWTIPLVAGTLTFDAMAARPNGASGRILLGGGVAMLIGYALSCVNLVTSPNVPHKVAWGIPLIEPPFVAPSQPVNIWTMSQRAGSVSYLTFAAGFSALVYVVFIQLSDDRRMAIGLFRTLGTNALAGYIIHDLVNDAVKPLVPRDSPWPVVLIGFGVSLAICYLLLRYLERHRIYLKL
jgi:uncharacterized membrane protein YeiB